MAKEMKNLFKEEIPKKPPKPKGPRITVNGVGITQDAVNREAQYHPAENLLDAKKRAAHALVIRELLLQEAMAKGLCANRPAVKDEEDVIARLLEQEILLPEPDETACRRFYKNNLKRFETSPLYEVSHILLMAPANRKAQRVKARKTAQDLIEELEKNPHSFEALAKKHSACTSGKQGGFMGQISKKQTTRNFEKALFKMQKGEISKDPVETRFGYHIIKVHQCAPGKTLAYDTVKDVIAEYLTQGSWQRAVSQYLQILVGQADISGINLKGAETPLVQ